MISRKQTWCKLAVMIAEGLETPAALRFHGDREDSDRTDDKRPVMGMSVESTEALNAWAAALSLGVEAPTLSNDGTRWIHTAYGTWCGYHVSVVGYAPAVGEVAAVEGMDAVRAVARDRTFVGPGELERSGYTVAEAAVTDDEYEANECYECETTGVNCIAHRTAEQKARAGW